MMHSCCCIYFIVWCGFYFIWVGFVNLFKWFWKQTNKRKKERKTYLCCWRPEARSAGLPYPFPRCWAEPAEAAGRFSPCRVGWPVCSPRAHSSLSGAADESGPPVSHVFFFLAPWPSRTRARINRSSPANPGYPTRIRCCSAIKEKSWPPLPFFHLKTRVWSREFEHWSLEP
jgi:hypothetical protein